VRHRIASFSQESTRYCNYYNQSHLEFIIPHWLDVKEGVFSYNDLTPGSLTPEQIFLHGLLMAEEAYNALIAGGKKPEDARDILPIDVKTEIVVTANLREWLLICNLRTAKAAHPNMRQVMSMVLDALQLEYPEIFGMGEADEA
jgi:thymidylate synthase (FAD)